VPRASVWYERNGLVVEAVGHALSGSDLDRVERLVAERALTMIYHGELATLMGWVEALPARTVRSRPWLCVAYAWVLAYAGQPGRIEPLLEDAEGALKDLDEAVERRHIAGHIAAIRAYTSVQKQKVCRAVALTREALEHLPEGDLMVRSFTTAVAAIALRMSGDLVAAVQATTEAIALAQAADADYIAVDVRCDLARLQMARGQLREAAATCQDALRLAGGFTGRRGWPLPITGYVFTHFSLVLHERNDLQAALHHARDSIELCRRWGEKNYLSFAYIAVAKTLLSMGDAGSALDAIQQARQAAADLAPSVIVLVAVQEIQIRLAQGDTAAARRWAQASGLSVDDELEFHRHQEYCTLARVLIACGELGDALTYLARLLEMAEAASAMGLAIGVLVLQAIALRAKGQVDRALTTLSRALALAEPEGYVRTFIDEGAPMGHLLRQAIVRGIAASYANKLLAALEGETKDKAPALPVPSQVEGSGIEGLIEPLSEREREVLRLLTTHLSRREIAEELCVSVNTVRFHVKNIYAKLGVHSRSDAIQRAAELNLL
jgi:LuxR family maltose regulon positive regulatory protein